MEAEYHAAWEGRAGAWTRQETGHTNTSLQKNVRRAYKQLARLRAAGVERFLEAYIKEMEELLVRRDRAGFYAHLKSMGLEGRRSASVSQYAKDEDG